MCSEGMLTHLFFPVRKFGLGSGQIRMLVVSPTLRTQIGRKENLSLIGRKEGKSFADWEEGKSFADWEERKSFADWEEGKVNSQ